MRLAAHSLRGRLVAVIGVLTAAALVVGFSVVTINDVRALRRDMVHGASLVARVVAEYSASTLVFDDRAGARDALAKLAGIEMVEYASLLDASGRTFAVRGQLEAGELPDLAGEGTVRLAGGALHVVQPVTVEGERYGTLYLRASTAELQATITRHVVVLLALLVALLALTLAIAARLARRISGPILSLAAATREISRTDDHTIRVPVLAQVDEVATLCRGINDMLDQIQLRELERDEALYRTREKSQFLAAMSHELRTPLNSIIGFSEVILARGAALDPKMSKFMTNILASGRHLLEIINNILDLSKVEAGKMEFQPETIIPAYIIESVISLIRGASDKRGIEVTFEPEGELPRIEADAVKLKQVFFNLLSNAVKFSPDKSTVRVVARALNAATSPLGEASVAVDVVDRGIGIAPADQQRIFQPFQQAEGGISRAYGGTGLGLALTKAFVTRHGGTILLQSALGEGTTVTVVLPVQSRIVRGPAGGARREARGDPVLVVEDDIATRELVCRELASASYEVFSATSVEEATRLVTEVRPAAVLVDIALPGGGGWETLRQIRRQRAFEGTPVAVYAARESRSLAFVLGFDDYVLKPADAGRLVACVGRLMQGTRSRGGQVLVVDDDRLFRDELQAVLEPLGFKLAHAATGPDALAAVERQTPSLVVLDVAMAGMGGLDIALGLRALPRLTTVPILLATAAVLTAEQATRLHDEVAALVRKGDEASLLPVMRGLLARRGQAALQAPAPSPRPDASPFRQA